MFESIIKREFGDRRLPSIQRWMQLELLPSKLRNTDKNVDTLLDMVKTKSPVLDIYKVGLKLLGNRWIDYKIKQSVRGILLSVSLYDKDFQEYMKNPRSDDAPFDAVKSMLSDYNVDSNIDGLNRISLCKSFEEMAEIAKYKRSSNLFAFHQHVRGRSVQTENIYRLLASFTNISNQEAQQRAQYELDSLLTRYRVINQPMDEPSRSAIHA